MLDSHYEFENLPYALDPNIPPEVWFKTEEMKDFVGPDRPTLRSRTWMIKPRPEWAVEKSWFSKVPLIGRWGWAGDVIGRPAVKWLRVGN